MFSCAIQILTSIGDGGGNGDGDGIRDGGGIGDGDGDGIGDGGGIGDGDGDGEEWGKLHLLLLHKFVPPRLLPSTFPLILLHLQRLRRSVHRRFLL